jgi:deoxyribodipyrimidine photo-lyase
VVDKILRLAPDSLVSNLAKLEFDPRVCVRGGEEPNSDGRCVAYRMRRAQRAFDNPALEIAIAAAAMKIPVVVCFGLMRRHPIANLRHYHFMLAGLADTAERLERRGVGFVLRICDDSNASFAAFCETIRPSLIIADEDPARREPAWRRESELYRRVLRSGALMLT